jgi:hypothetical protein
MGQDTLLLRTISNQNTLINQQNLMLKNMNYYHKDTRSGQTMAAIGFVGSLIGTFIYTSVDYTDIDAYASKQKVSKTVISISGILSIIGTLKLINAQKWFSKSYVNIEEIEANKKNKLLNTIKNVSIKTNEPKQASLLLIANAIDIELKSIPKGTKCVIRTSDRIYNAKVLGNAKEMLQIKFKENRKNRVVILKYNEIIGLSIVD